MWNDWFVSEIFVFLKFPPLYVFPRRPGHTYIGAGNEVLCQGRQEITVCCLVWKAWLRGPPLAINTRCGVWWVAVSVIQSLLFSYLGWNESMRGINLPPGSNAPCWAWNQRDNTRVLLVVLSQRKDDQITSLRRNCWKKTLIAWGSFTDVLNQCG